MLTFQPVTDLVDLLEEAEVRATVDPSDLNLPGAWVTVESIQAANLAGTVRLGCAVYLVAPDQDYQRAMEALADLYNRVVPGVLTPDGPTVLQGVILPDTTTALPALRVPVNLFDPA